MGEGRRRGNGRIPLPYFRLPTGCATEVVSEYQRAKSANRALADNMAST